MNGTGDGLTETNKPTINWVTRTICILGGLFGLTICVLSYLVKAIPPELNTIAGIVIGGLLSMLTNSKPTSATSQPTGTVTVPQQTLDTTNQIQ